jgi:hypothetical protein
MPYKSLILVVAIFLFIRYCKIELKIYVHSSQWKKKLQFKDFLEVKEKTN